MLMLRRRSAEHTTAFMSEPAHNWLSNSMRTIAPIVAGARQRISVIVPQWHSRETLKHKALNGIVAVKCVNIFRVQL